MDQATRTKLREVYDEATAECGRILPEARESWKSWHLARKGYLEQRGVDDLPWGAFPSELKHQFTAAMALDEQAAKTLRAASQASQAWNDALKLYTAAG